MTTATDDMDTSWTQINVVAAAAAAAAAAIVVVFVIVSIVNVKKCQN